MIRKDILNSLGVGPQDIVLEVGPGNMPFWRSDIFLERDLFDNRERAGDLDTTRPCVLGDAHKIPFGNKTIDFIMCAQVLEHATDPVQMLKEISRVGKRGYIETPNFHREMLFGWPFHRWVVEKSPEGGLVIYKNDFPQYFSDLFHRLQVEDYWVRRFFEQNFDKFNTVIEWEGEITCRMGGREELMSKYVLTGNDKYFISATNRNDKECSGRLTATMLVDCIPFLRKYRDTLVATKHLLQKVTRKKQAVKLIPLCSVIERMRCYECGADFERFTNQKNVCCSGCNNSLEIRNGSFIIDHAYAKKAEDTRGFAG